MLALFALLCQSLVLLLPQPAQALPADAALFAGGYVLCLDEDDGGGTPASDHDKAPCPHCVDCPLCQAFHAAGGLVPPTPPALPAPTLRSVAFAPTAVAAHPRRLVARAHQPRAPPSIPSL